MQKSNDACRGRNVRRSAVRVAGLCLFAALPLGAGPANAQQDGPASCEVSKRFPGASLAGWNEREFEGSTEYRLVGEVPEVSLSARADGSASVLYRDREVRIADTPLLRWSWSVDAVYDGIAETTRDGDDFPARLYVVVKTGVLPWQTLALNYVWASAVPVGESWESPYTDKARMIAVRSGSGDAGAWVCQTRDVVADFRTHFGVDVDEIDGYAVMVDGDNGARQGQALFGAIDFLPR